MAELVRGIQHTKLIDQFAADDVSTFPKKISHQSNVFVRNPLIREKALKRAGGICECCGTIGFITSSNGIFLETHHIIPLANQGEDSMNNISAICPNCHRRAHLGIDAGVIADKLKELRKNVK
ncbi:MAG: HNH endonuclease [Ignavibacteria bacterium]|nr:HNH endonuclease [Ignavibacteria bacterium]